MFSPSEAGAHVIFLLLKRLQNNAGTESSYSASRYFSGVNKASDS